MVIGRRSQGSDPVAIAGTIEEPRQSGSDTAWIEYEGRESLESLGSYLAEASFHWDPLPLHSLKVGCAIYGNNADHSYSWFIGMMLYDIWWYPISIDMVFTMCSPQIMENGELSQHGDQPVTGEHWRFSCAKDATIWGPQRLQVGF